MRTQWQNSPRTETVAGEDSHLVHNAIYFFGFVCKKKCNITPQ